MGKKNRFDKLDELLQEEYDREVRTIEENLSNDGSFDPSRIDSEALYLRIQEEIKAREEAKKKSEEEEKEKKREKRERVWHVMRQAAIFIIVLLVGIFGASMSSEAYRSRLNDKIQYLRGNEVVHRIGGDGGDSMVQGDEEELQAYQQIKDGIGIPVPYLIYKKNIEKAFKYDIIDEGTSMIKYQYGDVILRLYMANKDRTDISGTVFHGKKVKEVEIMGGLVTVPIQEIKDETDVKASFAAQWEYENGYYQLSGKMEEKEFIEIVENIGY